MSTVALVVSILFGGFAILYARSSANHAGRSAKASEDAAAEAKRSADAAEVSAHETRRANADRRTPNVVVTWLPSPELGQRWNLDLNTWNPLVNESSPTLAAPGGTYVSPAQDSVFVSVAARIHIKNKSDTPVRIQIDTLGDTVQVYNENWSNPMAEPSLINVRTGEITIDPLIEIDVRLYCGVTVANWITDGKPAFTRTFDIPISASYEPDGATLHWNFRVQSVLLVPSPFNNSGAVLPPNLPLEVELSAMPRTYGSDLP
jgi:hypothetical protein